jgi:hypothetical protein
MTFLKADTPYFLPTDRFEFRQRGGWGGEVQGELSVQPERTDGAEDILGRRKGGKDEGTDGGEEARWEESKKNC